MIGKMPTRIIMIMLLGGGWTTIADVIYSNDFASTPAADFTSYNNGINFTYDAGNENIDATRGTTRAGWYQLTAAGTQATDFTLRSHVSLTVGTPNNYYAVICGITGRAQAGASSFTSCYYAVIGTPSYDSETFALRLGHGMTTNLINDGKSADMGMVLATGTYTVQSETDYIVELNISGSSLTASLYSSDGLTRHDQISATDSTYSSGQAGYVAVLRSSSSHGYLDEITLETSVIPEPGSLVWIGALLLAGYMRRMRLLKR